MKSGREYVCDKKISKEKSRKILNKKKMQIKKSEHKNLGYKSLDTKIFYKKIKETIHMEQPKKLKKNYNTRKLAETNLRKFMQKRKEKI